MSGIFQTTRRAFLSAAAFVVLTTSVATAATAAPDVSLYGETLLWRLDPPGGGMPSYVVGTIHVVDERLEPAIARASERLQETGALVVETDLSQLGQLDVMQAMMLSDGRTLPDIIGEDQFARLVSIAEAYGMPAFFLRQLAPWGAAMMISLPPEQMEAMAAGQAVFDQRLVNAAQGWSLPVDTLEAIDEQISAFADHPEADQVVMLEAAIEMYPQLGALVAEMIDLYAADDLSGLATIAMQEMDLGDAALSDRVMDALITDRNHRMAERVIPLLEERPHLVAIGAMHLPGKDGVLNLLAQRGWTVTPVR